MFLSCSLIFESRNQLNCSSEQLHGHNSHPVQKYSTKIVPVIVDLLHKINTQLLDNFSPCSVNIDLLTFLVCCICQIVQVTAVQCVRFVIFRPYFIYGIEEECITAAFQNYPILYSINRKITETLWRILRCNLKIRSSLLEHSIVSLHLCDDFFSSIRRQAFVYKARFLATKGHSNIRFHG